MVELLPGIFAVNFFVTSFGVIYTGSIPTSKFGLEKQKYKVYFITIEQVLHILKIIKNYLCLINILKRSIALNSFLLL